MKTAEQIKNLNLAIGVMERVKMNEGIYGRKLLYMSSWQCGPTDVDGLCRTEEDLLHQCGTMACLGGFLAMSHEFQKMGWSTDREFGCPVWRDPDMGGFGSHNIYGIFHKFFGLEADETKRLCHLDAETVYPYDETVDEVIAILKSHLPAEHISIIEKAMDRPIMEKLSV